jgi:hypothetical protein
MALQVGSQNEGGMQVLISLTPSSETEGSLLRIPDQKSLKSKRCFTELCYFLILENLFLGLGTLRSCTGAFPEGGWDTGVDKSNSI